MNELVENSVVRDRINEYMEKEILEHNLQKAVMTGVYNDLERITKFIEEFYEKNIFYLSYWECECGWHGWEWSKDDGKMASMKYICDEITAKVEEIYGLAQIGLGLTKIEEKEGAGNG